MKRHGTRMSTPHSRLVDSITEQLVTSVTSKTSKDDGFRRLCEGASTRFKANVDPHPDPHAVREHFTGLVEKFAVLGRDDIADPLDKMLPYILSQDANVEVLTLLLALSDNPTEAIEFNERKYVVESVEEKGVTWDEILEEDPLVGHHWNEPDYSGSDEDEDWVYETKSPITPVEEPPVKGMSAEKQGYVNQISRLSDEFLKAQFWSHRRKYVIYNEKYDPEMDFQDEFEDQFYLITELHAIREILFMLSGLDCVLFSVSNTSITVNTEYRLDHASADALTSVLSWFAEFGSSIHSCRIFTKSSSKTAALQAFSAALSSKLHAFTSKLANLQTTYANLNVQTISLLSLQNLLHDDLELFYMIKSLVTNDYSSSALLTRLHDLASEANSIGSTSLYNFILDLFLPSLGTYLRPLHAWMTHGDLDTSLYPDFFITSSTTTSENNHNQHPVFELVKKPKTDIVTAPRFMLHVVNRVLAAGKTMDFLKRMHPLPLTSESTFTPFLQQQLQAGMGVNPFEQAFENALEVWINKKYEVASNCLRESIHDDSELWRVVNCVHGVYCMLHYQSMCQFTHLLFQKMNQPMEWRDRHVLTDDLQESFSEEVNPSSLLSVRIQRSCALTAPLKCLESLKIHYKVSWPTSDILKLHQNGVYQQILTFLLQLQRTKYVLDRVAAITQQRDRRGLKGDSNIVYVVRLELSWFVNTLLHHLGVVVIESTLRRMKEKMKECKDVEELSYVHTQFTSSLQYQCLLSDKLSTIHNSILDILTLSTSFTQKYISLKNELLSPSSSTRKRHARTSSLSDDEHPVVSVQETTASAVNAKDTVTESGFLDFVRYLDDRFMRVVPFVRSGLKGSVRAAEFPSLGILAASLEAGVR